MVFNFRGLLRFLRLWSTTQGWTTRRIVILVVFLIFYPVLELMIWCGLWFDKIRFKNFVREPVQSPVFIIGNPRSGTTFLHRLLAKDVERFSTMQMWEILLCPSITQRKVILGVASAIDRVNIWFHKSLDRLEAGWREKNVMHTVSFRQPEEDDYLLLHTWSALTTGLSSGLLSEALPYTYFDTALPRKERHRIMAFYKSCVQRHLYAERELALKPERQYLAKNPSLSPKINTVFESFPDAKLIYLVRNPLEVIPSYVSMMIFSWRVVGIPINDGRLQTYILDMARHWYRYPLEQLAKRPKESYIIVRYDDLVREPGRTVQTIYDRFGFLPTKAFSDVLGAETTKSRDYKSRHNYSLAALGLNREMIVNEFEDLFERFDFDRSV
jgi:hypothetical protein